MSYFFKITTLLIALLACYPQIHCHSSDADKTETALSKEIAELQKLADLPLISDPSEYDAQVNALTRRIPEKLVPGNEESQTVIYRLSDAIIHFMAFYMREQKLRTKSCATALAKLLIKFGALLKSSDSSHHVRLHATMYSTSPPPDGETIAKNSYNIRVNSYHGTINRITRSTEIHIKLLIENFDFSHFLDEDTNNLLKPAPQSPKQ